jgi:hypothetical protein
MGLSPEQIHSNLPNIHRQKIVYGKIKWWTDSSGAADNRSSFVYAKTGGVKISIITHNCFKSGIREEFQDKIFRIHGLIECKR